MADAAADATPLLPGLPDDTAIWEILVRLPPKSLLRCRAVSPAWRRATSTPGFLLSHHARQPALPLLYSRGDPPSIHIVPDGDQILDIVPFDHRAAGVAAADRFQSIARLKPAPHHPCKPPLPPYLEASCDGLLLLSIVSGSLYICNPATRQYAPLYQFHGFRLLGMYPHPPTGEYRLLVSRSDGAQLAIYVFTIGSSQPPRRIMCPHPDQLQDCDAPSSRLLFKGSIYWYTGSEIMVFDTTDESFKQIRAPVDRDNAQWFETGDMLGIFCHDEDKSSVDIWVMLQNHQSEAWDFKCRVELPVAETRQQCRCSEHLERVMVVPGDGGLLILLECGAWLFLVDVHGKLIASFHYPGIMASHYLLKQTLVQHTFFPTLEDYVVNPPPFI